MLVSLQLRNTSAYWNEKALGRHPSSKLYQPGHTAYHLALQFLHQQNQCNYTQQEYREGTSFLVTAYDAAATTAAHL